MRRNRFLYKLAGGLCLIFNPLLSDPLHAEAVQNWHYSGFLNQAFISTSDNNFFGKTDDGVGHDYWEAGAMANGNITPVLQFNSQLLARRAGKLDGGHPRVDQLSLDYHIQDDFAFSQGITAGRMKAHYGLYNSTRDVPFTRPSILLSQSLYFDRARNTLLIWNAVMYYAEFRNDYGFFKLDAGFYRPIPNDKELADYFATDVAIRAKGNEGRGVQFTWRSPLEQYYVGIAVGDNRFDFKTFNKDFQNTDGSFNVVNSDGSSKLKDISGFFQYFLTNWALTVEFAKNSTHFKDLNTLNRSVQLYSLSYSAQIEYHFSLKTDFFIRYDTQMNDEHDPHGEKFVQSPLGALTRLPNYSQYAKDAAFGSAWRPSPEWLIRFELHNIEGVSWVSHRENKDPLALVKYWNLAALQVSYRF